MENRTDGKGSPPFRFHQSFYQIDDRTPFEWDIAKEKDEDLLDVNVIGFDVPATYADINPVPIPAVAWMLGGNLIGLLGLRRRFKS